MAEAINFENYKTLYKSRSSQKGFNFHYNGLFLNVFITRLLKKCTFTLKKHP